MNKRKLVAVLTTIIITTMTATTANRKEFNVDEQITEKANVEEVVLKPTQQKKPLTAVLPSKEVVIDKPIKVHTNNSKVAINRGGDGINNYRKIEIEVTFYDNDKACTGKTKADKGYGITASGRKAKLGTIAVDKTINLGTKVYIPDLKGMIGTDMFIAEDRGSAIVKKGNVHKIDVWVSTHGEALKLGKRRMIGYILEEN